MTSRKKLKTFFSLFLRKRAKNDQCLCLSCTPFRITIQIDRVNRQTSVNSRHIHVFCRFITPVHKTKYTRREVPEPADRRVQTRRMPLWNALDSFIRENLVLPVMYDSVHSVLVKQHGYIQWTNCTKNTLLGN